MPYQTPPKTSLTWPQAVVILGLAFMLLTAVTILALAGRDVTAILGAVGTVVVMVAGLFGLTIHNKLDRAENIANGRLTDALEQNAKLQEQVRQLALMVQPPESS
jgi:protein-S-isoprenylcysteine O-methyltransferase Ste14